MRYARLLIALLALIALLEVVVQYQHREPVVIARRPVPLPPPKPAKPPPKRDGTLVAPSPADPKVLISEEGPPRDVLGTAFPVRRPGLFMTARHVVDACDRVGIVTHRGLILTADSVVLATGSDLALFEVLYQPRPLALDAVELRYGQSGYAYGFPRGRWGRVRGMLIGRGRAHRIGREEPPESILMWAIIEFGPKDLEALSGMSGGPMLDATGNVIGVNSAASLRRGRLSTVAPVNLNAMLAGDAKAPDASLGDGRDVGRVDAKSFFEVGERLRRGGRIARVLCDVAAAEGIEKWWKVSRLRR